MQRHYILYFSICFTNLRFAQYCTLFTTNHICIIVNVLFICIIFTSWPNLSCHLKGLTIQARFSKCPVAAKSSETSSMHSEMLRLSILFVWEERGGREPCGRTAVPAQYQQVPPLQKDMPMCADVCKPVWNTMSAVLTGYTCCGKSSREIESLKGDLLQSGICKKPSHEPQHTLDKRITECVHGLL